ncbi:helix-hairpin-helix domain-containing protein [Candidatus Omnitrophota bacterium]
MNNNKGIALILVVSILAVAGIMAVSFAFTMRLELKAATNYLESTKASYLAEAGASYAQAVLREDDHDIDSFEDNWHMTFTGSDVDNDGDGQPDSKWIYIYDERDEAIGRYAVLIRDETSLLNINIANKHNISPLKVTEGWTPHELDLQKFLASFKLDDPQKTYEDILGYRYGPDKEPGEAGVDDNENQRILRSDGIDNNADGIIDEAGEGIDEPMEFASQSPYADDNAFETPFELAKIESIGDDNFDDIYPYITSYSVGKNVDINGALRENINFIDAASLLVLLQGSGIRDSFQKAANIIDACDEDFSQSSVTKLYSRMPIINRGPIGDWIWKSGHYESDVKNGEALMVSWFNLPEGEYYIGMFGVEDEFVGDVTINGVTQRSVKHGELLRFGTVSFENKLLELVVENKEEDKVCYFSYLDLYPRLGQEGFNSIEIKGVEGIRINEVMVKPVISRSSFSGQVPGGDWIWEDDYYQNDEPNGGKPGEGSWIWKDIPDGKYYVRLFAGITGQQIGDVEINGYHSRDMLDADLFGDGRAVNVSGGKIIVNIQNNLLSGSAYFRSIELSQEPDAEYIELVNLTAREVSLDGWSLNGPGKEGWPASIPFGTVIGPHDHLVLCVDKNDSQAGIDDNGISFISIWGKESSAELHFLRSVIPGSDLFSNDLHPLGNFITLKDAMGHVVDQAEYFVGSLTESTSLEKADPSYILDSNSNGVPDNWYLSKAEEGATPGLPNDNDGMKEVIEEETLEHDIKEVNVKNKNFSSIGEVGFVALSSREWQTMPVEDISKIVDRLTTSGIRLEAEGHIVPSVEDKWKIVQRAFPLTDHFESGEADSVGMWRWEEKDGFKDGYYKLRVFGEEEEAIAVSLNLGDDVWTPFTPPLTPGPNKSIFFGNIEVGTGSDISTPQGVLEIKIKNVSKTGAAHFDFIRLNPLATIDGRININTASKKVLSVLPGVDEQVAESIIANRVFGNRNGLRLGIGDLISSDALGLNDLDKKTRFKQISNLITVHSDIYRVIVTAQTLEKGKVSAEKKLWAVFDR